MRLIDADVLKQRIIKDYHKEFFGSVLWNILDDVPTVNGTPKWIPVTEGLPEEHDSMFAKWYGTPLWKPGMFRTTSGDVLVCVEFGEGSRLVSTARTNSGEWNISGIFDAKVTHWMPLPEPPEGGDDHA